VAHGEIRNATDEEVMMEVARGSEEAFDELLGRYQRKVLSFFSRFLQEREAAKDLTQECFLRLLCAARRYRPSAKFSSYLFTIARRLAYDERSKAWHRREELPRDMPSRDEAPDRALEKKEAARRLEEVLASLPDQEREVFLLSESAGLRYAEIGRMTGVPEGTVASRKNRAVRLIRERWKGDWE
jgi:RNA polymerase sigma-70 factor (ECF subfamily)